MEKRLRLICKLLIISLITAITYGMCGCKGKSGGSDYIFVYDLSGNPATLDPQTAVDEYARLVMGNIFEGLLRMDSNGNISAGAAMEYEISDDLLSYTFYLREDVFWTDKNGFYAKCTANDFVFGFSRLFNPQVKSRNAADYYCILNARKIREGEVSPDLLGVYADGDFKLVIRLEYPDVNFPVLLAAPPAFPCNEEFYIQSSGRYGLIAEAVPSNGSFFLREWVYDPWWTDENRIILRRNSHNGGTETAAGVNYLMDRAGRLASYTSGESDCIIIRGDSSEADRVDELKKKKYPCVSAENSVWGVVFNSKGRFSDGELRKALAFAADTSAVNFDGIGYRRAVGIVPDSIRLGGELYRDLAGVPPALNGENGGDSSSSSASASSASAGTASVTATPVLIVPVTSDKNGVDRYVRQIAQQWQEKLSLYCKIDALPIQEYSARLAAGDYDIAAVKLTPMYNSPSAVFDALAAVTDLSGNKEAAELLSQARQSDSGAETAAERFLSAESAVLQAADFIPICFVSEYFFRAKKSEGIVYNPFTGAIMFRDAKMS